jgi:L-malate glycosyltransferase
MKRSEMHKQRCANDEQDRRMATQRKYTVLILTDTFNGMAGSERNITQLMNGIDKAQFTLSLACIYSGSLAQSMREEGHSIYDLHRGGIYTINGLKNILFLRRLIKEKQIDLIVTYHEASDFYGLLLAKMCRVPIISSRRDMGFKTRPHHQLAYKLMGRLFDRELTVCYAVKEEMIKQGWFPADRIYPVYNGVDLRVYGKNGNDLDLIKRNIGIESGRPVVGIIANMRKIKGIQYFIEAASSLHKQQEEVEFVIIGGDTLDPGYTIKDMQAMAEKLGVSRNVHFLGRRGDIPELISIFDVAVVASLSEGFSNTIIEYMASSKPVVATRVGGNAEAVLHGQTGLLVSPEDPEELAEAVWLLLRDKETALQFGAAGRKRAEERFSLGHMIKNYEHMFEQVINRKQCL